MVASYPVLTKAAIGKTENGYKCMTTDGIHVLQKLGESVAHTL